MQRKYCYKMRCTREICAIVIVVLYHPLCRASVVDYSSSLLS